MIRVAIGLGSNMGDRQANLVQAVEHLREVVEDVTLSSIVETPALLPEDAPQDWDKPFLNAALTGTTSLPAEQLLQRLQQIEQKLGRQKTGVWSPRSIDLDILLYGDSVIEQEALTVPHPHMLGRDFVMRPLCEIAADWVHPVAGQPLCQCGPSRLMGIVNVTPDSFSDGGEHFSPQAAIAHAQQLLEQGAAVLDIGSESTRPRAEAVSPQEEWNRLQPVIKALAGQAVLSVDTRHESTARQALAFGAHWINDVSGASNEALIDVVALHPTARYVLMHSLSVPADASKVLPETVDVVQEILGFARQKLEWLEQKGIARDRVVFDVGIGFGKTPEQSLQLVERIAEFKALNVPLLVGHSRKSFLKLFTDSPAEQRDALTLKFSKQLSAAGVDYLRVHNVALHQEQL